MLLIVWKHTERNTHINRKDYLLLFPEVLWLQYRAWHQISFFSNHFKDLTSEMSDSGLPTLCTVQWGINFGTFFSREKVSGILFKASIMYKLFKSTGNENAKLCKLFLMLKVLIFLAKWMNLSRVYKLFVSDRSTV